MFSLLLILSSVHSLCVLLHVWSHFPISLSPPFPLYLCYPPCCFLIRHPSFPLSLPSHSFSFCFTSLPLSSLLSLSLSFCLYVSLSLFVSHLSLVCLSQTIARMTGVGRKHSHSMSSFSAQMPALAEEAPVENERGVEKEVGIDCPPEFKVHSLYS